MTRKEQNKNWSLLSEESKYHYQTEYKNRLEDAKREIEDSEGGGDLTVLTSQYIAKDLEILFGKHNLKPKLTYEDVAKELFEDGAWQPHDYASKYYLNKDAEPAYILNCTSQKQSEKLVAINKLLNTAKFLNKNEDGTDWVPDWKNDFEYKWYLCVKNDKIYTTYVMKENYSLVYFRTEAIAKQAIEILGYKTIRTALGNY